MNICYNGCHDWYYDIENTNLFNFSKEALSRVLELSKGEANEMSQWVLKENGDIVPRRMICLLYSVYFYSSTKVKKEELFCGLVKRDGVINKTS